MVISINNTENLHNVKLLCILKKGDDIITLRKLEGIPENILYIILCGVYWYSIYTWIKGKYFQVDAPNEQII